MLTQKITLPWPPSNNTLYKVAKGRKMRSKKGIEYLNACLLIIANTYIEKAIKNPVKVEIEAWPPDNRRRDLDNLLKAPLDAITKGGIILDDSLIHELSIKKERVAKSGRLDVFISEIKHHKLKLSS